MRDDGRSARLADQADPDLNRQFARGWIDRPKPREVVTGPNDSNPAHPLALHNDEKVAAEVFTCKAKAGSVTFFAVRMVAGRPQVLPVSTTRMARGRN